MSKTTSNNKIKPSQNKDNAGKKILSTLNKGVDLIIKNPVKSTYVIGGAIGLYLLYNVVTAGDDAIDKLLEGDKNIDDSVTGTGGGFTDGNTISQSEALNLANQLLDAMNDKAPLYGTDEDLISKVFDRIKNASDFLLVYKAFGLKDYNGNNSPPTGIWSNIDSYKKQDLVYWLRAEINSWLDWSLYNKIKPIVESSGFAF